MQNERKKTRFNEARNLKFFALIPRGRSYAAHAGKPSLPRSRTPPREVAIVRMARGKLFRPRRLATRKH